MPNGAPQAQTLAQMIRAKYPGSYDDMNDQQLESSVLSKYPQYGDLPRTQAPAQPAQAGYNPYAAAQQATTLSAAPTGILPWLKNVGNDIRSGSGITGPGRFLQAMGAQGTSKGESTTSNLNNEAVGNYMASPILGSLRAAQGIGELGSSGQRWQGTKDILGGVLDASQIPLSAMVGPESEAVGQTARATPGFLARMIGASEPRAAQNFQQVASVANKVAVPITNDLSKALGDYQSLVDAGGSRSLSVSKLLGRLTDPDKGPLTYEEARKFYSNISRLSADEMGRLTAVMKRQVGTIRAALGDAVQQAAENAGQGQAYSDAMTEYAKAKNLQDFGSTLKSGLVNAVKYGVPSGIGGAAGGYMLGRILGKTRAHP